MVNAIIYIFFMLILFWTKNNKIVFWCGLAYLCSFAAFCYVKADVDGYQYLFLYPEECTDMFYAQIIRMFKAFHLNFYVFMSSTMIVNIILLGHEIWKNAKRPNTVLALYMLSPFLVDNIQMRNFIAYTIVTIAVLELLSEQKYVLYTGMVFIAFNFHTLAIFYFAYLIASKIRNDKLLYILTLLGITLIPICLEISKIILPSIDWKLERYLRNVGIHMEWRRVLICMAVLIQIYIFRYITKNVDFLLFSDKERDFFSLVYKINIVNILALALILYASADFFRITRNVLIINYIAFISYYRKTHKRRLFILLIFSGMIQGLLFQVSAYKGLFVNNLLFMD